MNENDIPQRLFWIDLEMTGLDPSQRIIEVAIIVTDQNLHELDRFEAIIHQSDEVLSNAEDWPKQYMQELFEEVRRSTNKEKEVVKEILALMKKHFGDKPVFLAGNSIHQDRRFIRQWWPEVEAKLHYRMLDVSSFKIWVQATRGEEFVKGQTHRALDDIVESIDELKWALAKIRQ